MNFKKSLTIISILFLIIVVFFLFYYSSFLKKVEKISLNNINYVKIGGQILKIDLALSEKEQERGLSGRESIGDDEGMLFVFKQPSKNYFWMKDMNFPIDIIWIDENFRIIFIEKNVQPSSYPNSFGPNVDNKYVLEVKALFSEKNNLKVGNTVEFSS